MREFESHPGRLLWAAETKGLRANRRITFTFRPETLTHGGPSCSKEPEYSWAKRRVPFAGSSTPAHSVFTEAGYTEVVLPAIWGQAPFVERAGPEVLGQMYAFDDKKGRPICLIPEATALIQELYREQWSKSLPKPVRVFYVTRCWRYERPQKGRYREFWQLGAEILGGAAPDDREESLSLMTELLDLAGVDYTVSNAVQRGLDYYTEDGFEAECAVLGAQKQVAGGGRYAEGVGFALGLDRLLLARSLAVEG